jgi:DNA polymerase-1
MPVKNIFTHTWLGGTLAAADYAGAELRIIAAIADCGSMKQAFADGVDIHRMVTSRVFKIKEEDVTKEQRHRGKGVSFAIVYAGNEHTLHELYNVPVEEGRELLRTYFDEFPEIRDYQESIREFLLSNGYVVTPLGRKLYIPEVNSPIRGIANQAMRTGINMPIQATASDMLQMASIVVDKKMVENNLQTLLVNEVHDSLVADCYPGETEMWTEICRDAMENLQNKYGALYFPGIDLSWMDVPMRADFSYGDWYGTMKEIA